MHQYFIFKKSSFKVLSDLLYYVICYLYCVIMLYLSGTFGTKYTFAYVTLWIQIRIQPPGFNSLRPQLTLDFEFSSLGLYIKVVFLFLFFQPRDYLHSSKIVFTFVYGVNLELF